MNRGKSKAQASCLRFFCLSSGVLYPVQDRLHGQGAVFVAALQGVGIDAQRGVGLRVAQAAGHGHGVNVRRKQERGVGVPLRYNYDKPEKPRISRVFGYQARFFILFQPEKSSREVVIS